jgi:hypothetical protein
MIISTSHVDNAEDIYYDQLEIDRLALMAESDIVQDMESDSVEPDMEIEFITGLGDEVSIVSTTHTEGQSD